MQSPWKEMDDYLCSETQKGKNVTSRSATKRTGPEAEAEQCIDL
jgi:hypothetical protein